MRGALETSLHTTQDVRCALGRLMMDLSGIATQRFDRDLIELVLAEALNNIQEHGDLPDHAKVKIDWIFDHDLTFSITDPGLPCPKAVIYNATLPAPADLAEGGYGWGLIQLLCNRVEYVQAQGNNILTLAFIPITGAKTP